MKIISNIDELATFALLERCLEECKNANITSASRNERLNKLQKIRDNYLGTSIEEFLSELITEKK